MQTKRDELSQLAEQVKTCQECGLCINRIKAIPGEGNPDAKVFLIGEAGGLQESLTGRPFIGRAGQLLTQIIENGMGLKREDVYITNVVKCRPPNNRVPTPEELAACYHFWRKEIDIINPQVIITLGKTAFFTLSDLSSGSLKPYRLQKHSFKGIPVVPTWHPAYLLRQPAAKSEAWEDIKFAMRILNENH